MKKQRTVFITGKKKVNFTDSGFTLFEIILVITIIAVVSAFGIGIISSIKGTTDNTTTQNRMNVIALKAQDYYLGHGGLPASSSPGTIVDVVPTEQAHLDLEQKYRLDAWGQYLRYYLNGTDIVGVKVDGSYVAAVLISGGPDEVIDTTIDTTAEPGIFIYNTTGDDILVPISVSAQAVEVALEELKVLQAKVHAYNKVYEGVDNDNDDGIDENGPAAVNVVTGCPKSPPTSAPLTGPGSGQGNATGLVNGQGQGLGLGLSEVPHNDPSTGTFTLDNWGSYTCPSDYDTVLKFIVNWYGLGGEYLTDPWGNDYQWGGTGTHYHIFYSYGPDGPTGSTNDDITP